MYERFTKRFIEIFVLCFIVIGAAKLLWDIIPTLIKILAIILIVVGVISIFKNKN